MRRVCSNVCRQMRVVWQGLREWSGDAAYEKYMRCVARAGGKVQLTATEFYVEQLNRRYSRPNRCC